MNKTNVIVRRKFAQCYMLQQRDLLMASKYGIKFKSEVHQNVHGLSVETLD